ncbi:MAG: sulfatase-like hydrolase/transferase [Pirellulaceae bacterium]|nr:sulfatase-like hydrolase/transferase [Pirellulaceae bacterium]
MTTASLTVEAQTDQVKPAAGALPDIIYILSDDHAYNDYSFMGHQHIRTPNLDKLAKESRLFTRGYVPDSLCRPSLATIITGMYPHQHGIVGNDPPPVGGWSSKNPRRYTHPEYQGQLEKFLSAHIDRLETLPDRLNKLGYISFQTGKWWEGHPKRGGFDEGMTHGDHNRGGRHGDVGLEIGRKGMQPIAGYVQKARAANQPYFLWYAPMLPHTPHDPPERLLSKYRALAPTEPIAKYWAMCELFDETIGQLRDIVQQHGRPDNTLIVYVTDNGWINLPNKSAYAPRSKRSPNEGGLRTPIMFCWPGHLEPSRNETQLVSSIDLVPTTLALLKQPKVEALPGINVLDPTALSQRTTVYGEIFEHDIVDINDPAPSLQYRWIINGFDKTIVPASRMPGEKSQHYNLKNDPSEDHDLAATPEGQVKIGQQTAQLDRWWKGN